MHQQQARDELVVGEGLRQFGVGGDREPHHPFEAGAVEVGDLTDQLLGALVRHSATCRAGVEQGLDPIARRAPLRFLLNLFGL